MEKYNRNNFEHNKHFVPIREIAGTPSNIFKKLKKNYLSIKFLLYTVRVCFNYTCIHSPHTIQSKLRKYVFI